MQQTFLEQRHFTSFFFRSMFIESLFGRAVCSIAYAIFVFFHEYFTLRCKVRYFCMRIGNNSEMMLMKNSHEPLSELLFKTECSLPLNLLDLRWVIHSWCAREKLQSHERLWCCKAKNKLIGFSDRQHLIRSHTVHALSLSHTHTQTHTHSY